MKIIQYALCLLVSCSSLCMGIFGDARQIAQEKIRKKAIAFFEDDDYQALSRFSCDELAEYKRVDGSAEQVKAALKNLFIQHALGHFKNIELHYELEKIESNLAETGLSPEEAMYQSINIMNTVFKNRCSEQELELLKHVAKKGSLEILEKKRAYVSHLFGLLKGGEYQTEGERIAIGMLARDVARQVVIAEIYGVLD